MRDGNIHDDYAPGRLTKLGRHPLALFAHSFHAGAQRERVGAKRPDGFTPWHQVKWSVAPHQLSMRLA